MCRQGDLLVVPSQGMWILPADTRRVLEILATILCVPNFQL